MKRRDFITSAVGMSLFGLPANTAVGFELGDVTLTSISDGSLLLPSGFIFDSMPGEELAEIRAKHGVEGDQLNRECNLALLQTKDSKILFDVGSGPDFMPSAGKITDSLGAAGLSPEDITHVIFTHAHPDHIWGLLDDFDDPLFYNASYMMGRKEWDYWWDPTTVDEIGEARQAFAVGARRRMEAIEDQIELFDDGDEVLPGVSAFASYGHTPGHMAFEVRQGSEAALIVGDAIGDHHVAFERPQWPSGSDQDPDAAIVARQRLLDRLESEQMRLVGFHLPNGGIGRVEKSVDGYRFVGDAT